MIPSIASIRFHRWFLQISFLDWLGRNHIMAARADKAF